MIVQGFIVMRKMKEKYLGLVVQRGGVTSGTRGHRLNPPPRKLGNFIRIIQILLIGQEWVG